MSIMSSLNGLVCVRKNSMQPLTSWYDTIIWNPLTGDYKTLSKDISHGMRYELYYSCCDDDYRLLCVTMYKDAFIYSLKSDSWRKVESTSGPPLEYLISSLVLDLWKMDKDGEWTKVVSCCGRLSKREFYLPLHLMKNGNWLVGPKDQKAYAYEVDLAMKTTKEVWRYTPTDDPMKFFWGGKFVETIVSVSR
ncbi:hypothetical protein OSB04_028564 [Centaurea solstitialis]|uniref:F-box associated beta-propeller type 3 domain-containing protein n=1 Tax=Centaurea solstitialis TaxID=347529 RepID=A0AA38SND7_9ASTR|nr:hypothetical protein OSB04_028564 [Centaurea solstitialis]